MKFKEWMESKGLKHKWVAERLGIGKPYLSDIINGKRQPSEAMLNKLSWFTCGDVSPEEIAVLRPLKKRGPKKKDAPPNKDE